MTQFEYLKELEVQLSSLEVQEKKEIMYDYEEHFKEGVLAGKSEDEIIESLGSPKTVASAYIPSQEDNQPKQKEQPKEEQPKNEIPNTGVKIIPKATQTKPRREAIPKKGNGPVEIIFLSLLAVILLSIFVIPWYVPLWVVMIAIAAIGCAFTIGGFATLLAGVVSIPVSFISLSSFFVEFPLLAIAGSVAMISIGGLILIASFYIAKGLGYATYYFSKWLISLIRGY